MRRKLVGGAGGGTEGRYRKQMKGEEEGMKVEDGGRRRDGMQVEEYEEKIGDDQSKVARQREREWEGNKKDGKHRRKQIFSWRLMGYCKLWYKI